MQASTNSTASEPARFDVCVRPQLHGLRSAALRLTRNLDDAEDLVQETTLRAFRFWGHYQPGSNLRAWLHRILLNTFVNSYRRARRERELCAQLRLAAEAAEPPLPNALQAGLSDEVERGLAELPSEFRSVLWAVAVDDLSYREAADRVGCPVGTIMSRLHRARHTMQQALRPYALANGHA